MPSTTWMFGTAWGLNESGSVVLYVATPDPAKAMHEANETGLVQAHPIEPHDPLAAMFRARQPAPPAAPAPAKKGKRRRAPPPPSAPAVPAPAATFFVVAVAEPDFPAFVRWFNDEYAPRYFPRAEDAVDVLTEHVPYELLPWAGMGAL